MPEEINRVLISDLSELNFAPTKNCVDNLMREGISSARIFIAGPSLVDLLHKIKNKTRVNNSKKRPYILITIHRRENVDNSEILNEILSAINRLSHDISFIFPCHPHTKKKISKFKLDQLLANVTVIKPVSYFESLRLIKNAKFVMTDSGGIQQKPALLNTPCITLRPVTEWIETVEAKVNFLAGQRAVDIIRTVHLLEAKYE